MRQHKISILTSGTFLLALAAVAALAALAAPIFAGTVEVKLTLPVRARIDLEGRRTIAPVPFIMVSR